MHKGHLLKFPSRSPLRKFSESELVVCLPSYSSQVNTVRRSVCLSIGFSKFLKKFKTSPIYGGKNGCWNKTCVR